MSAATDALRKAFEALDIDEVESEMGELRDALDAARDALLGAQTDVRAADAKLQAVDAAIRGLLLAAGDDPIPQAQLMAELDKIGGPNSSEWGLLDDLEGIADDLESAGDDITSALGDAEPEPQEAPAPDAAA
jgi:hypothetical protein